MWIESGDTSKAASKRSPSVRIEIPDDEITFETSTSGGPGGQHANRVETRVTLVFDLGTSSAFTDAERDRIRAILDKRVSRDGRLRIQSDRYRSQRMNRDDVIEKFRRLIASALEPAPERKSTRVPPASREKRLEEKKRRAKIKRNRLPGRTED